MTKTKKRWLAAGTIAVLGAAGLGGWSAFAHGGPGGPPQKDMTLDAAARHEVIVAIGDAMTRHYVFPEQVARLSSELHSREARGDFNGETSADHFADTLTQALQATLKDKHLEVRYFADPVAKDAGADERTPAEVEAERVEHARFNHGVARFERLQGNIGYLELRAFGRPADTAPRYAGVMALMKDTGAMIIDLRHCEGGDPDSVMLMASYLFDKPTHLNDIWMREGNVTEARWTDPKVLGPHYGQARPVVLVVGPDTFSACEDLAYGLKNAGRATLVGETTGGGAHPGQPRRLTDHFMMNVPGGRSINAVTHTDWEGTGVSPDVKIAQGKALERAQLIVLQRLVAAEKDPDWKRRVSLRVDELK